MVIRLPGSGRRMLPVLLALALFLLPAAPPARAAETAGPVRADVILLLDRSGSMQQNDPRDLAATGARVFVDMLDPADRVAVVAFDSNVRTLLPLTPVGDGAAARRAISAMGRPTGQWTDIQGALAGALEQLGTPTADRAPAVVLFTDGKPDLGPSGLPSVYMDELIAEVSRAAGRSIPVFAVGLGQADFDLLGRIATGTRAESFAATSATQVVSLFSDVLSRIKERQVVLSVTDDQVHTFQVSPYTRLLTISGVGTGKVALNGQAPGGGALAAMPGLKVSQGTNYTVYTIPNPAPGTWTLQLAGAGPVSAQVQSESALRLSLTAPQPYSQVPAGRPVPLTVAVAGDPDPQSPLEVWAQAGAGDAVKLARAGAAYMGSTSITDGRLTVWATRAGSEVARREFRLYPVAGLASPAPVKKQPQTWPWAVAAAVAAIAAALGAGALNWRRIRRQEEQLSGRLGTHSLNGRGRTQLIGDLAKLEARLVPRGWAPLAGLGLVGRELQIYIHQAPGIRIQINSRPPGDGRLYDGDEVALAGDTYTYINPRLPRRPVPRSSRSPVHRSPGKPTLKG